MSDSSQRAERLRRAIGDFVRATRADADALPDAQAAALGFLDRQGASTIADVARGRGIRHQSMRVTIENLEQRGLVERQPDPSDARSVLIRLTDGGRTVLAAERGRRTASIAAAIDRELDADEQADLDRLIPLLERLTAPRR